MNKFCQKKRKIYALWLIVGLLTAYWVGQTHAHTQDSQYDADLVCSICLVGENLGHYIVTASCIQSLNSVNSESQKYIGFDCSLPVVSYYLSRAPPLYL
jgi:hypothetical protein